MQRMLDPVATSPLAVGQAIRRLRHERGMTQAELAEACVLRQATVSAVENGAPGTRLDTLFRLLAVLRQAIVFSDRLRLVEDLGGSEITVPEASER